jgi:hypothetical protein
MNAYITPQAQHNVGVQLEEGDLAPKNKKKRKQKNQAQHNVGVQLAEGDGAPKNQRQAAEWYNKAVAAGQVRSTKNKNKIKSTPGCRVKPSLSLFVACRRTIRPSLRGRCDGVGEQEQEEKV